MGTVGDMLSDMDEGEVPAIASATMSAAADNELVRLVNKIIVDAYQQGASDIHIEPRPGKDKDRRSASARTVRCRTTSRCGVLPQCAMTRLKIMWRSRHLRERRPQDGKIQFKSSGPLDIELRVATIPPPAASRMS